MRCVRAMRVSPAAGEAETTQMLTRCGSSEATPRTSETLCDRREGRRICGEDALMNPEAPVLSRPNLKDPKTEEQIRQRAYVLYEARGRSHGRALDDWLQAEKEVLALREAKAATNSA